MQLSDEDGDQNNDQFEPNELPQIKKEKKSKKDKKKKKRKHRHLDAEDLTGAVDNIDELTCLDNEAIKNLSGTALDAKIKQLEKLEQDEDNDYKQDEQNKPEEIDEQIDKIEQELQKYNKPGGRKLTVAQEIREKEQEENNQAKKKMNKEGADMYDLITKQLAQTRKGGKSKHTDSIQTANLTIEETIKQLDDQMEDALLKDLESNKQKKPAFLRLKLLDKIDTTLRKLNLQEDYLEKDGSQRLSDWLKPMPDNTYPNQKIILCILGCVDRLPISQDQLKDTDLENSLEVYRNGQAGPGYIECQRLAKSIMDKWYREKYHIQTTYDSAANFDKSWINFQKDIQTERFCDGKNEDLDDEGGQKKQKTGDSSDFDHQQNVSQFFSVNNRQRQLNFTTRPQNIMSRSLEGSNRRRINCGEQNSGWQKLKKTLQGFKKQSLQKKDNCAYQQRSDF